MEHHTLQIVNSYPDGTLILDEETLRCILTKNEIKNRYVSVISVTGAFRLGKSFLLNFLLRYLRIKYVEMRDVTEWLQEEDGPLKGFSWLSGSRRHTTGIHMWSEIFLTKVPTGEEVAIMLIDTQGAFDNQTSMGDCAKIFALSTLISSVQIFNVMRNIKQHDLSSLELFGGYGSLFTNFESTPPFQNLVFLVRDWACPYEKPYGNEGGCALLQELFDSQHEEVIAHVTNIKSLFSTINCFLLPYPGRIVDVSNNFDGNLDDIVEDFKTHVQEFVTKLLSPENLVLKTINGEKVKAQDFMYFIQEYSNILKEGTLPKMETIYTATSEAQCKSAADQAFKLYKKSMNTDLKRYSKGCISEELFKIHHFNTTKALDFYNKTKKLTAETVYNKYLVQLKDEMDMEFQMFRRINDENIRQFEELKKKMLRLQKHGSLGGRDQSTSTLGTSEKVGIAAGIIGGVAVLALGAAKLFSSKNSNN